jgi:hypothetical protein
MLFFNSTHTHGVLSFVASGHVVIFEGATREPKACIRMSPGAGGAIQPHAAFLTPDDRHIELLHVGPIDPEHLARWLDDRLDAAGVRPARVGRDLIERAGPRTQDVLQAARHVYARSLPNGVVAAGAADDAIADVVREEDAVIRAVWMSLTPAQQNVLRALAGNVGQLFSGAVRQRYGLPTSSSVATAVDALEGRGLVVRDPLSGGIGFDSPFVRAWVVREALGDVPEA